MAANTIVCGDTLTALQRLPDESVHLAITSPPYWNTVDYGVVGQLGQSSYEQYIADLLAVWRETARVLVPNGKLCINTPIMPVPKRVDRSAHTRQLKNINTDIEASILYGWDHGDKPAPPCDLLRYSLFIWQKQTSEKMFGSYPYPPNLYEDNTIEFINVFVKPGRPRKLSKAVKEASRLTQQQWVNLTMQVWPIYPADVARAQGHPAPFPLVLPQRLIAMYSFQAVPDEGFDGDIVLDMFNGTGSTCLAARAMRRRYIGIELNPAFCDVARERLRRAPTETDLDSLLLERVRMSKKRPSAEAPDPAGRPQRSKHGEED